jgi:hypothetical protein
MAIRCVACLASDQTRGANKESKGIGDFSRVAKLIESLLVAEHIGVASIPYMLFKNEIPAEQPKRTDFSRAPTQCVWHIKIT